MKSLTIIENIQRIDELRLRYKSPQSDNGNYTIVAHGGNIWLLSSADDNEQALLDIQQNTGVSADNADELSSEADSRPDVFVGDYDSKSNKISYIEQGVGHHPISSPLLKKLAQHFNVNSIDTLVSNYDGYDERREYGKYEMEGDIPDEAYHGTSTGSIKKISKFGLDPNLEDGNWDGVGKFPLVFLTTEFATAAFHSGNANENYDNEYPVILQIHLPDKSQIVPDFDVASMMLNDDDMETADEVGYTASDSWRRHQSTRDDAADVQQYSKGVDPSKTTGIFAYKKRIPAKFITAIYANFSGEEKQLPATNDDYMSDMYQMTKFTSWEEFFNAYYFAQAHGLWSEEYQEEIENEEEDDDIDKEYW